MKVKNKTKTSGVFKFRKTEFTGKMTSELRPWHNSKVIFMYNIHV